MQTFQLTLKDNDRKIKSSDLSGVFSNWNTNERWLFVSPHDDDLCMGAALLMQKAVDEKIPIRCLITTDGRMGYGSSCPKDKIVSVRREETINSFKILGIDDFHFLNFPDCSLFLYGGARKAEDNDPCILGGQTGVQNAYVYHLRHFRPTRVFVPAGSDLHPDHKIVYQEILISLFHAAGDIWPQLGTPLLEPPSIYEMAIYCDFPEPPDIRVIAPESAFEKKLASIRAYKSQNQIESLVENIRKSGPVEYFRNIIFNLYSPEDYKNSF